MTNSTTLFSFDFVSTVKSVYYDGNFPAGRPISEGDSITGRIIYDLSTKDRYSELRNGKEQYPCTALYEMNPKEKYYGFAVTINGNKFLTNPDRVVVSNDETYNNFGDRVYIKGSMVENPEFRGIEPSFPFGLNSGYIKWDLRDDSMKAINGQELPTIINLQDWGINDFQILGSKEEDMETIYSLRVTGIVESVEFKEEDTDQNMKPSAPPTGLRIEKI